MINYNYHIKHSLSGIPKSKNLLLPNQSYINLGGWLKCKICQENFRNSIFKKRSVSKRMLFIYEIEGYVRNVSKSDISVDDIPLSF
jgi:hypothetical protein